MPGAGGRIVGPLRTLDGSGTSGVAGPPFTPVASRPAPGPRHPAPFYVFPEPFLPAVRGGLRVHLGDLGGSLSAGPVAPEAGGFHPAFLGRRRGTDRGGAPQAHS